MPALRLQCAYHEAILNHDRDALVHIRDFVEDAVNVRDNPIRSIVRQPSGRPEASHVVGCLVDRCNSEVVDMAAISDERKNGINSLVAVRKICGVEEPIVVADSLANIETVDAAGERVQANDDMHVVLLDSVLCEGSQEDLLIASIQLRARDLHPSCVSRRNAEGIDAYAGKLVDGRCVDVGGVTSFKSRTTIKPQRFAERPFVVGIWGERVPP
jgi:hypothetical protein